MSATATPPQPTSTPASERPNSALIVVDVQTGVMDASWNAESVISTISDLVDRARAADAEVIWVRHTSGELPTDSPQWQIVDALSPEPGEAIVEKTHGNTFEDTDFEDILTAKDIGHLVVTGAQSDACIRSTIHGGFARGYDVTLVSDAHTTEDLSQWGAPEPEKVVSHTNLYWGFESGPGRTAKVEASQEIDFDAG